MLQEDKLLTCHGLNKMRECPNDVLSDQEELDIDSTDGDAADKILTSSNPGATEEISIRHNIRGMYNLLSLEKLQTKRDKISAKDEPFIPTKLETIATEEESSVHTWLKNTDTTFTDMPIEPVEMDNSGLLEIYRKMMLIDLFQTELESFTQE